MGVKTGLRNKDAPIVGIIIIEDDKAKVRYDTIWELCQSCK